METDQKTVQPPAPKSLETTELKLKTTPTGGVAGEHSPYYRRLISAGYKGYIQGVMGGAGYYGVLGLVAGAIVGIPAAVIFGPPLLMLLPVAGAFGIMKGASTFGNIGSTAAINAESADMAEQRRYLLDRYYELPDGPEGDKQADIIKQELINQTHPHQAAHFFHWKTVAVCAAIGAALALTAFAIPAVATALTSTAFVADVLGPVMAHLGMAHVIIAPTAVTAIGTSLGALFGATVGIDRRYIRKWFDATENLFYDDSHAREAVEERGQQIERLRNAEEVDQETKRILDRRGNLRGYKSAALDPAPSMDVPPVQREEAIAPTLNSDQPSTKINSPQLQNRLADIQQAMQMPAV